eukprot:RCo014726
MSRSRFLALARMFGPAVLMGVYIQSQVNKVRLRQALPEFETMREHHALACGSDRIEAGVTSHGGVALTPLAEDGPLRAIESYADVVSKVAPAVATVELFRNGTPAFINGSAGLPSASAQGLIGFGSGVLLRSDGILVTSNHVIAGRMNCYTSVLLADGRNFPAQILVQDEANDLAMLRLVHSGTERFPVLLMGDPARCCTGDVVLAVGSQMRLPTTVTCGIISAVGRSLAGVRAMAGARTLSLAAPLIQTDAPINRGSSGGALVTTDGKLIGINTMLMTSNSATGGGNVGLGFAVPSNYVAPLLAAVDRPGHRLVRTWDGLAVERAPPGLDGVSVKEVFANGPAERAKLHKGDRIIGIDDLKFTDVETYCICSYGHPVDRKRTYRVIRGTSEMNVRLTVEADPRPS